jgi:hypothetical protein
LKKLPNSKKFNHQVGYFRAHSREKITQTSQSLPIWQHRQKHFKWQSNCSCACNTEHPSEYFFPVPELLNLKAELISESAHPSLAMTASTKSNFSKAEDLPDPNPNSEYEK